MGEIIRIITQRGGKSIIYDGLSYRLVGARDNVQIQN